MPLLDVADQESIHLRFKIGDRVLCWHGTWLPSTIVKLFYVQPNFPPGKCVPYKVRAFSEPTNDKANAAGVAAAE